VVNRATGVGLLCVLEPTPCAAVLEAGATTLAALCVVVSAGTWLTCSLAGTGRLVAACLVGRADCPAEAALVVLLANAAFTETSAPAWPANASVPSRTDRAAVGPTIRL